MTKKIAFEKKKINMETLPEYLKAARESFSYDVKHVAKITNISDKFILDLEKGAYHRLPAEVYVYGFLRKLAELYRTDSELLIEQYKKERGIHENITKNASGQVYKPTKLSRFVITPKTIAISAFAAFFVFILGYLFYQVHAINTPPAISVQSPADGEVVHSSSVLLQGHVDVGSTLNMNDQQILVDSSGNFKQLVGVTPGAKVLTFVAKNNFGKQSTKQISVIADFQTSQAPVQNDYPVHLTITVDPNSTWISTRIDDGASDDETFIAGSHKDYSAKTKILVSTGDAGSTSITLNGKNLGKLGRDGEVLRDIPFTADNVNSTP